HHRRIPGRARLPHRNDEVTESIATETLVSLARCFLVAQDVPGHRAIRSNEIDCLAIPLVTAPGWSGAGCLAVGRRVEIQRQAASLWSAESGESRAVAERSGVAIRTDEVGVVQQVAGAGPVGTRCPVAKAAAVCGERAAGGALELRAERASPVSGDA